MNGRGTGMPEIWTTLLGLTLRMRCTFRPTTKPSTGDAIRRYLQGPLRHGVTGLAFDVTWIKQESNIAWDVGTYHMSMPQNDGTKMEDHSKYLTVWKRMGVKWLIIADAWSSDLAPSN